MKRRYWLGVIVLVLVLGTVACGGDGGGDGDTSGGGASAPSCESPARGIVAGNNYREHVNAATSYPENCLFYCLRVPAGSSRLTVQISGFDVDLDLYVGQGGIDSVMGEDAADWVSNDFGDEDEEIQVSSPEAGTYYIQVCSYEGEASDFQLETDLR